ncbi:putative serine/threonine-protein kinase [Dichanthelium oligosanthes]|uniref:non-specific serine/threonine protein kinase n=1 Tax=Dichanthelium oligosanthes TaxID=888268 RepID=A0A1E5WI94_9POAL|nr:putative serine/threonine-protein kinase [Dichanthelium oligosanthes]
MWRLNPFGGKAQSGLEGRTIDVGNVKITVRNAIAEGGFSCVYLACDTVHPSKLYALKYIICNDSESLDLVMKEIQVMNLLKGHPNVVTLVAHDVFDMGRTKEALLVMEFCEKSLVSAMESRGSGYYEEKKVLLIFRDVCNAVFAMHGQSPPIAHRDLKAENVLLGFDGAWKICDFGSTSTNHKCFNKPEEMGIEEDIIRKHTTPAYRAPEMWDLYRREVISEKVDIWALGCLLYRICYFKSAFDGESKLQILNGNYRIPEQPKYSTAVTGLIKDMLEASPNDRLDITQARALIDWPFISMILGAHKRTHVMPKRNPPPPPREQSNSFSSHGSSRAGDAPLGAFWATQHAQGAQAADNRNPLFDEEPIRPSLSSKSISIPGDRHGHSGQASRTSKAPSNSVPNNGFTGFSGTNLFTETQSSVKIKAHQPQPNPKCERDPFNSFVADFDTHNLNIAAGKASELELEVSSLKEQLKKTTLEKAEMTAKYEKLSAICRSQRQEIQELKRALAETTPPSNKVSSRTQDSGSQRKEKIEGTVWELEQGMLASNSSSARSDVKTWQAFPDTKTQAQAQARPKVDHATNGRQNLTKNTNPGPSPDAWGFGTDNFRTSAAAVNTATQINRAAAQGSSSQRFSGGVVKKVEQPSGWAGF